MRARLIVLILPILLIAGFVALNWSEFLRTSTLSLGFGLVEAPLGLVMLALLTLALLGFLASAAATETEYLLATRQYARELSTQRELADKAEASRFTELRVFLDNQARDSLQREEALVRAFTASVRQSQQELQTRIDQQSNSLAASLGELEDRLERRDPVNAIV
ncbi:MAG: hypothetical protein V4757_22290 [Pseudomonadota bacterium]